jgi:hypothetical protein
LYETQIGGPEEDTETPGSGILRLTMLIAWSITIVNYLGFSLMEQLYGGDVVSQMLPYLALSLFVTAVWLIIKVYAFYKRRS